MCLCVFNGEYAILNFSDTNGGKRRAGVEGAERPNISKSEENT
jgi:hypothetical protein